METPSSWDGLDNALLNRILTDIDGGLPDGNRYSDARSAGERAAWKVVLEHAPQKTEAQAREIIKVWVANGVLVSREYRNAVTRKDVTGLHLDTAKRPGSEVRHE